MPAVAIILLIILFLWLPLSITLWVQGTKKRSTPMTLIGSFLTLGIIGIIIGAIQVASWTGSKVVDTHNNINSERLELEKQKFELEKQKFELEKAKEDSLKK